MKDLKKRQKLLDDLERLEKLETSDLRDMYELYFDDVASSTYRKSQLVDEITYKIQSKLYGGLSKELKKQIKKLVVGTSQNISPKVSVSEGVQLVRNWNGVKHTVTVVDGGFEYKGEVYKSLSKVAKVITGSTWSGPVFFGLKKGRKNDPEE